MYQKFILTFLTLIFYCSAKQAYFELANDPDYPELISVSDVRYELIGNRFLEIDCTVTIYEEINDATNVSSKLGEIISIFLWKNKQKCRQDKMHLKIIEFVSFFPLRIGKNINFTRFSICIDAQQFGHWFVGILPKRDASF